MSQQSFADLGVSRAVAGALAERGITQPFAIQQLVIADVLAGHDVLAKSPTGSGKTIAFGAPIADRIEANDRRPAALILAPTRELASQIVEDIRPLAHARALKIAAVYGGVGIVKQARAAAQAHIVVATPGRLEDLLQRGDLTLNRVRILVLDEADRMLDMGFKPAVDRIVAQCPAERQTLFFSATLDGEAGRVAKSFTRDARRHEHAPTVSSTAATEHRFVAVERDERIEALLGELRGDRDLALVFVRTKRGVDRLVKRLSREGVNVVGMHVAARGIDVSGISHVINFDPPEDRDGYVHRIGRTGRAGRTGVGVTFVGAEQARDVERIAAELRLDREFAETALSTPARPGRSRNGGGRQRSRPRSRR
jgi:superfamily II DNA/RNA helicase